jgi:glycosyltransferase involved in cell wall biosynthesis
MPRRILILIGGHFATAPRAQKEARALIDAGYEVEVGGIWFDEKKAAQDLAMSARNEIRFTPALDFRGGRKWCRARVRLRARFAREIFVRAGLFTPALLGYGARELLALARKKAADLTIVHSEAGLWVGAELGQHRLRTGIDFEDWFSRDLPPPARRERPVRVLEKLERRLAQSSSYVLAPSHAMAGALARAYAIPTPEVIYNCFPPPALDGLRRDRHDESVSSLHWFSQSIGPDRGLELLFAALPLLKVRAHLYLRGACSPTTKDWLDRAIPSGSRAAVTILPPVSSAELPSRIAEHDLGFALESAAIPSRDLSVSNKLFQYLQAGLAVIATDTQGQREVLAQCGEAGMLLSAATPPVLAQAIDFHLSQPARLARAKKAALAAASDLFSWERQRAALVLRAERALHDRS